MQRSTGEIITTKGKKSDWLRKSVGLMDVIRKLEKEIKQMKERGAPIEAILSKDASVDQLIEFYNNTESLMNQYEVELATVRITNKLIETFLHEALKESSEFRDYFLKNFPDGNRENSVKR